MSRRILGTDSTLPGSAPATTPAGELPALANTVDALLSTPGSLSPVRHVLAERYEILGLVGAGGMGAVYRAHDAELDELVALKMLRRDIVDQPGILDRFRQEVRLARRVTHRNVARTYDIGEHGGDKFITMEFIDGESLAARLARQPALPFDEVMTAGLAVCVGLEAAHAAGIVHRDLKPDNVLLERGGRVVLTDFGVARALSDAQQAVTAGLALGTPAYMAPEQVEGVRDLDGRADLYALGAILYECLVGERAWSGDSLWATLSARLTKPPPDPRALRPDLPSSVAELVLRCLARRREDRPASAGEVAKALGALTMPSVALRPSMPPPGAGAGADGDAKTVAVLPFRNLGAPDDTYLADGVTDDLVDALSMTPGLRVISRGAVQRALASGGDAREVGRELCVQVAVEGSVRRVGSLLRVSARVVSVADGFQLWARRFDRPEPEVFAASDELATAVAEALTVRRSAPARAAPANPRALALYLRARHALHVGWGRDVAPAIGLLEQALALAPDDARILAALARVHLRWFTVDTESDGAEQAARLSRDAAERALASDPACGEARAALAQLKWSLGDSFGCARDLREALRLSPGSADVVELHGRMLLEVGEPERAVARLLAAVSTDPTSSTAMADLLRGQVLCGDWSAYETALERGVPAGEGTAYWFQLARLTTWRRSAAHAAALRALLLPLELPLKVEILAILELCEPGHPSAAVEAGIDAWGKVTGRARRRPMFLRQLSVELGSLVGHEERALATLEDVDRMGLLDVTWLDRCPLLGELRGEPRFSAVRERVAARAAETLDVLEGRLP